jgi:hypothetical protein
MGWNLRNTTIVQQKVKQQAPKKKSEGKGMLQLDYTFFIQNKQIRI